MISADRVQKLKATLPKPPVPSPQGAQRSLSSVLVAMGPNADTGREEILLTKRTMLLESHKGQVSFPGGYWESSDATLVDTALRESLEEIGTAPQDIEILGGLESVRTHQGVDIYPWVGWMRFPYPFSINPAEVEKVFFLPVETLLEKGLEPRKIRVGEVNVLSPAIEVEGEVVWGATARMLEHLRRHLLNSI